jgi:proteasome accessory factor C
VPRPEHRKAAKASERLRRLLVVVPYLVRHPGAEIAEVTRIFGVAEEELVDDLHLLFMSGLPPYGPGDLIDVEIQEGRVWIRMADYFARPLRLTRSEAITLYLRGAELAAMPEAPEAPALDSALAKLEQRLGPETLGELPKRVEAAGGARAAEMLEVVRDAVARGERLRIEYYATSSATKTIREIDAEEVFHAIGNWYVVAWDHRSDEERLFRADRIRSAQPTGERFEPRGLVGAGRSLYTPSDEDVEVRLVLQPDARWVAEYYEITESVDRSDGTLEVVLSTSRLEWLERLLLRLSGDVEVLAPTGLSDRVRELARRTREPYG